MLVDYRIIVFIIIIAIAVVLGYRTYTKHTMKKLSQMLDAAMEGKFQEKYFDESMLSALETKFAHYLAASEVSANRLHEQRNQIKTLISDISHQTKTPIANIVLYTQLLGEQELTQEGRDCAMALESQANKLQVLVDAMVKTSRLEAGVIALNPTLGPIGEMIVRAVTQIQPKADAKQIVLEVCDTTADAVFDARWTEEALFNLLDNAVKYTPCGGKVTVKVTEYPMFTAIHVADTGYGISEEEQPKIFSRFYRGLAHQEIEGVGIGLYLVRQIAQDQGGYVKVSSKVGEGATFSMFLQANQNLSKL